MDERGCELDILPKQRLSRKMAKIRVDERVAAFRGQLRRRAVQTSTSDSRLPTSRVHSEFTPHTLPFPLPVSYDFFYILKKKILPFSFIIDTIQLKTIHKEDISFCISKIIYRYL